LKKGYDFLLEGNSFTQVDAVAKLGVGKNMVSSIRFWLKAFGLTSNDELTQISRYIFDSKYGRDPFAEDLTTLWLLHYLIVSSEAASLYYLLFVEYQREKKQFTKSELQAFVKRKCSVPEQKNVYNENTVKKDIGVLLKSYVAPHDLKSIEDFSALLIALDLIQPQGASSYTFVEKGATSVNSVVILFALLRERGGDRTVSFDTLQKISLIFCMPITALIEIIKGLEKQLPDTLIFSDNSGIKNVQFLTDMGELKALDTYYNTL
jgi:hypothetical protein